MVMTQEYTLHEKLIWGSNAVLCINYDVYGIRILDLCMTRMEKVGKGGGDPLWSHMMNP